MISRKNKTFHIHIPILKASKECDFLYKSSSFLSLCVLILVDTTFNSYCQAMVSTVILLTHTQIHKACLTD